MKESPQVLLFFCKAKNESPLANKTKLVRNRRLRLELVEIKQLPSGNIDLKILH